MSRQGEIYLAAVSRVATRAASWTVDEATTPVPACPAWTAHDLVAHLAGGAADHAAGRLDGFPGEAWTTRHIAERADLSTDRVVDELLELATQTAARCDRRPGQPNSAWDAYIHEQDLAAAFGDVPGDLDEDGFVLLHDVVAFLGRQAEGRITSERDGAAVRVAVRTPDGEAYTATVPGLDAFRTMTGRAAAGTIRDWPWSPAAPPDDVLATMTLF